MIFDTPSQLDSPREKTSQTHKQFRNSLTARYLWWGWSVRSPFHPLLQHPFCCDIGHKPKQIQKHGWNSAANEPQDHKTKSPATSHQSMQCKVSTSTRTLSLRWPRLLAYSILFPSLFAFYQGRLLPYFCWLLMFGFSICTTNASCWSYDVSSIDMRTFEAATCYLAMQNRSLFWKASIFWICYSDPANWVAVYIYIQVFFIQFID